MSLVKNLLLIGGGLAAGYLAARTQQQPPAPGQELERVSEQEKSLLLAGGDSPVARFFDSPLGQPFKGLALQALNFSAHVRAGMQEKEAELQERFEAQSKDPRPGSLDSWVTQRPDREEFQQVLDSSDPDLAELARRVERDRELGPGFFTSR